MYPRTRLQWYAAQDMPPYTIRESARAKRLRVTVYPSGEVVVTKPKRVSLAQAERFLAEKREWALAARTRLMRKEHVRIRQSGGIVLPKLRKGNREYRAAVEQARTLVHSRLPQLNERYRFAYHRVSIRDQKTRWGSCSLKGNLNFNYKIGFLPPELADYLLVHELCHLKEMNHSPRFWSLVSKEIPDYEKLRKQLRSISLS
jgi:hypothetical protein